MTKELQLDEAILKLMRMPYDMGAQDGFFTAKQVHFGLLKVFPSLQLEEIKSELTQLVAEGKIVEAHTKDDVVYELQDPSVYELQHRLQKACTSTAVIESIADAGEEDEALESTEDTDGDDWLANRLDFLWHIVAGLMVQYFRMIPGMSHEAAKQAAAKRMKLGWDGDYAYINEATLDWKDVSGDPVPHVENVPQFAVADGPAVDTGEMWRKTERVQLVKGFRELLRTRRDVLETDLGRLSQRTEDKLEEAIIQKEQTARIDEVKHLLLLLDEMEETDG